MISELMRVPSKLIPLAGVLFLMALLVQGSRAKCPGFPTIPSASGPPDYVGIALDIGSMAFFGILGYFLVKRRIQEKSLETRNSKTKAGDAGFKAYARESRWSYGLKVCSLGILALIKRNKKLSTIETIPVMRKVLASIAGLLELAKYIPSRTMPASRSKTPVIRGTTLTG